MSSALDILTAYTSELLKGQTLGGSTKPLKPLIPARPQVPKIATPRGVTNTAKPGALPPILDKTGGPVTTARPLPTIIDPIGDPKLTQKTGAGSNDAYFTAALSKAGLPVTPQNLQFLNAWAGRENVPQTIDRFNLLGTTLPYGGSTGTNGANVQSYPTFEAGTTALGKMFSQSNFSALHKAFATGNIYSQRSNPELQAAFKLWSGGGYSFPVSGGYVAAVPTEQGTMPVTVQGEATPEALAAIKLAQEYLGTPYVWAGRTPKGFDCSGLLWYVWGKQGVKIPGRTYEQWKAGTPVAVPALRPGDAVFFNMGKRGPEHVGMYLGGGKFIESPRTGLNIRISDLSGRRDFVGARRYD